MIKVIAVMAFQNLINAYIDFDSVCDVAVRALRGDPKITVPMTSVIEKAYVAINSYYSLFDWFIHDVGYELFKKLEKDLLIDNLSFKDKLTIMGKKKNKYNKIVFDNIVNVAKGIRKISVKYYYPQDNKDITYNLFINSLQKLEKHRPLRDYLIHGSNFFEIDKNFSKKRFHDTFGLADDTGIPSLDKTINIAYNVSKNVIDACDKFYKSCFGNVNYGDGWRLNGLDYTKLLGNSGLAIPTSLLNLVNTDFPNSFKQSSPPSSSQ